MDPQPPRDRTEFAVRFGFAVMFFGVVLALLGLRFVEDPGSRDVVLWLVITCALGVLAALWGDGAWRALAGFFRWWG